MTKHAHPKKTGKWLKTASGDEFELLEYQFPESYEKFNVFVNGACTQAARTRGIGRNGDIRDYTYIKHEGRSIYAKAWIDIDSKVTVAAKTCERRRE